MVFARKFRRKSIKKAENGKITSWTIWQTHRRWTIATRDKDKSMLVCIVESMLLGERGRMRAREILFSPGSETEGKQTLSRERSLSLHFCLFFYSFTRYFVGFSVPRSTRAISRYFSFLLFAFRVLFRSFRFLYFMGYWFEERATRLGQIWQKTKLEEEIRPFHEYFLEEWRCLSFMIA